MRTAVGLSLVCALVALAGCGGGNHRARKSVHAASHAPAPDRAFASSVIAADAGQAGLPIGPALYALAAAAGVAHLNDQPTGTGSTDAGGSTTAAAAPPHQKTVSGQSSGQFAVVIVNRMFIRPKSIVVHIDVTPAQTGAVTWRVTCDELNGQPGGYSGHATMSLPANKTLSIPAPSRWCSASANVQLHQTGSLTVTLTAQ